MTKLRVLDLFSGIGGFSLGLERTGGFETVAFCEIDPFCQKVLRKHWPGVPVYSDVRWLRGYMFPNVDVITGGFPCQDISVAGKRAGIEGERSGLWSHLCRLIGEIRPRYAIVENVANLLSGPSEQRGGWFGKVLGDLAEVGYDAEWQSIPASYVGAPHVRDRVWIVATHADEVKARNACSGWGQQFSQYVAPASADHNPLRQLQLRRGLGHIGRRALHGTENHWAENWYDKLSALCGVDDGVSSRLDADLGAPYGNAVVPQIPEMIGRAILEAA